MEIPKRFNKCWDNYEAEWCDAIKTVYEPLVLNAYFDGDQDSAFSLTDKILKPQPSFLERSVRVYEAFQPGQGRSERAIDTAIGHIYDKAKNEFEDEDGAAQILIEGVEAWDFF